jgi:hypothetical protein
MQWASNLGCCLGLGLDMFSIYKQRVLCPHTVCVTREPVRVGSGQNRLVSKIVLG